MFQGGKLFGTYEGIASLGELITLKASGTSPEGHYVLLQTDSVGLLENHRYLHVGDFLNKAKALTSCLLTS